jgi:hypothetical protein
MVRISNTLLPTNENGVPQTELTNASIDITSSGTLDVSDATAQSTLTNIDNTLIGGLTVSDIVAQGELSTINTTLGGTLNVSDTVAQGSLSSIDSALLGTLFVSDSTAQSSLSSINTALAGTLSVSSSATINGSSGNLFNATSVTNGVQSSAVVISSYTKNTLYVSQTTGSEVRILVRGVNSGSYVYHSSVYPFDPAGGSNSSSVISLNDQAIYDIKLEATDIDTVTASILSRA